MRPQRLVYFLGGKHGLWRNAQQGRTIHQPGGTHRWCVPSTGHPSRQEGRSRGHAQMGPGAGERTVRCDDTLGRESRVPACG